MRRKWAAYGIGLGGLVLVGLVCCAVWAWEFRRWRSALEQAKRDLAEGRYAMARKELVELAAHWSADGEVAYELGRCEQARGRTEAAVAAWARVPRRLPLRRLGRGAAGQGGDESRPTRGGRSAAREEPRVSPALIATRHAGVWSSCSARRGGSPRPGAGTWRESTWRAIRSRPSGELYQLDHDPSRPKESGKRWRAPAARLPMTIGSGWHGLIWRPGWASSPKPTAG